jgi:TorA maturation chaperone TorD
VDLAFSSSSSSSSSYSTSVTQFLFLWVFRFFEQIATDSPLLIRELQNLGVLVVKSLQFHEFEVATTWV